MNIKNNSKKYLISLILLVFLFNISFASSNTLSTYDSFSIKFYCSVSSIFSKNNKCNSKPNISTVSISKNNDKLVDQISTLQNELNNTKKPQTITYTYPITKEKIVYIQGPKGDKGDKGDTTVVNNNNNTTNWSSVWIPDPKYQYVPVAGSNGVQGPAGSNGKDGNYITQITQDATNTTYYIYDPVLNSTSSVVLNNTNWSLTGNANTDPNINFIGTTDSQPLIFKVNNIENMRIATNGFIGMGTNNPLTELHLAKATSGGYDIRSDSFGQQGTFIINRSSGTALNPTTPSSGGILGTIGFGAWNSASSTFTDTAFMRALIEKSSGANDLPTALTFWTTIDTSSTPVERFRITNDGRIGQNITSPLANFQSVNTQNISSAYFDRYGGTADIVLRTAGGTMSTTTAVTANQRLGRLAVQGYNGSAFSNNRASIEFLAREDWTTGANGTAIDFSTTASGTNILSTKMRLDSTGYLGLGTTDPTNKLHIKDLTNNPIRIEGLQASTSTTDSIVVADADGVLKILPFASTTLGGGGSSPWYSVSTNAPATLNTENIYQTGKVSIGNTNSTFDLDVGKLTTNTINSITSNWSNGTLQDLTFDTTNYAPPPNGEYCYYVDNIVSGSPDHASWSDDFGNGGDFDITANTPISLSNGMTVTFTNDTGHAGDESFGICVDATISYTKTGGITNTATQYNIAGDFFATQNKKNSVFIGNRVFTDDNIQNSFFVGNDAGYQTTYANDSNFLGSNAGYQTTNASYSNFLGSQAGYQAISASGSNFLGNQTGYQATNANDSNFLGFYAGQNATNAFHSNFLGSQTGQNATNASNSNFFGTSAGRFATNANSSNFFGQSSGGFATNANNSNFFGYYAGNAASNAAYSNLFGYQAGSTFFGNNIGSNNIIIGTNISLGNAVANSMNIGGVLFGTGFNSNTSGYPFITPISGGKIGIGTVNPNNTLEINSNTSGLSGLRFTQLNASSTTSSLNGKALSVNANGDVILVDSASGSSLKWYAENSTAPSTAPVATGSGSIALGNGAQALSNDMFVYGNNAGYDATYAYFSNFLGHSAGYQATNTSYSNFLGSQAGYQATYASYSNFLGFYAGYVATYANDSNFIGNAAGYQATNASYSNFLGTSAGYGASSASNSNFFGPGAGYNATDASYSNLFGYQAGSTFSGNNIGNNNIIIGTNISLPNAQANSMNIGGVLFGTGFQSDTTTDPVITAVNGGKIGIGVVSPAYTLDVGNNTVSGIVAQFTNSTGYCTINPTNTALSCTSDINLKKNITNISDNTPFTLSTVNITNEDTILSKLSKLNPVFYNWNTEDDTVSKHSGFIAQQVEQIFPDLVTTNTDTNLKSVNYTGLSTYLVGAFNQQTKLLNGKTNKLLNSNNISQELVDIQNESSIDVLSTINSRINEKMDVLYDFISARITAVRGYFVEIFTKKIHTEEICVKKSDGSEYCINGDQLQSTMGNNGNTVIINNNENNDPVSDNASSTEENTIQDNTNTIIDTTSDTQISENTPSDPAPILDNTENIISE